MSKAREEYYRWLKNRNCFHTSDITDYVEEIEKKLKNSEESEKDLCNLLIECKHKIEKLEKENEELKAMLKSISDVSMGKIKFDIDNLLNRTILTNAINNVKLGG